MMARPYQSTDYNMISSWQVDRQRFPAPREVLPSTGYIVPEIAVGFLYSTDSSIGILESFYANPHAAKDVRDQALNLILEKLVATAREKGFSHVFGFSTSSTMIQRALNQGFKIQDVSMTVVKELD